MTLYRPETKDLFYIDYFTYAGYLDLIITDITDKH